MNLSTSMFVARVLCWERMDYALHVRKDFLEFTYHGSRAIEKAKGCCAGVLWWKRQLSQKEKLSVYQSVNIPVTCGHEVWVVAEITKTNGFPNNSSDRVRSSHIHCSSTSRGATWGASGICLSCLLDVSPGGVLLSESGNLSHLGKVMPVMHR